ncbi:MAG: glycosyltransferase family 39 protein, partial [Acidobacteria bacterium]|nr:glycosyltransferase family 39 protein [Acidobacteriota bacterium]
MLRLLHFWWISGSALLQFHSVAETDIRVYWEWAQKILGGDLLGRDTYHYYGKHQQVVAPLDTWYRWWGGKEIFRTAPLYPYWVAALLALSGGSLQFVILVQLLVGALHPLILFGLARRIFDTRAGLAAAALTALYGPFIFYQGVLLRDWLPPMVEPLAVLALLEANESGRSRSWAVAGAALGLAILTKETALLFSLLVGLWLLWDHRTDWRSGATSGACLLAGALLCLSPLILRNVAVGAPPYALSNRALASFIEGNAADSPAVGWLPMAGTMKVILERSDGKLLSVIGETLKTYQGDYGALVFKQLLKLAGLVDAYETTGEAVSYYYGREISPPLRLTLGYGFLFPLAVVGFIFSLPTWRRQRLVYLYLGAVLAGLLFSLVHERYRLTLVPVLILYAGAFLAWLADALRRRDSARVLLSLGLALGIALAQQVWLPFLKKSMGYGKGYGWGRQFLLAARVYESGGRLDLAVAEMVRLREKARQDARIANMAPIAARMEGEYRTKRATQLLEQAKRDEARRELQLAEAA